MTIFVTDSMRQCFPIKFYEILLEKPWKMKMKVADISGAKINHFLIFFETISCFVLVQIRVKTCSFLFILYIQGSIPSPNSIEVGGGELIWRRIGKRMFLNDLLKKLFFKSKGFLSQEYIKSFYDNFYR